MADNKNQAQLLEDYGENALSGAGGGGFSATITYDNDAEKFLIDTTWEDIANAYKSGKSFDIKYDDGSAIWSSLAGISYDNGEANHLYVSALNGGEIFRFDIYEDEGDISIEYSLIIVPEE